MKKLITFAIAILAICSVAAMADSTAVNWKPAGDYNSIFLFNFGNNGIFAFRDESSELWGAEASMDPTWLYNANDELHISVSGFNDEMFAMLRQVYSDIDFQNNDVGITLTLLDGNGEPVSVGNASVKGGFFTNGEYVFSGSNVSLNGQDYNVNWTDAVDENTEVGGIIFSLADGDIAWCKGIMQQTSTPQSVLLIDQALTLSGYVVDGPDAETEVPEPATFAYGIMGLASLMGMKKRFGK